MTEIEKMSKGLLYNSSEKKLLLKHIRALYLTDRFNRSMLINIPKRNRIIKKLVGKCGKNFFIMQTFRCEYGFNISFGDDLFVNFDGMFMDVAPITIGNSVMIGARVTLATPCHPLKADERIIQQYPDGYHDLEYARPITIEDGVWIASNVTVCGGVTIGKNSVIGAGSVVTHDVPPNSFACGVPCRVVREISDDDKLDVWETYQKEELPVIRSKRNAQNK